MSLLGGKGRTSYSISTSLITPILTFCGSPLCQSLVSFDQLWTEHIVPAAIFQMAIQWDARDN